MRWAPSSTHSPVAIICCDLERKRSLSGTTPPSRSSAIQADEIIGQVAPLTSPAQAEDSPALFKTRLLGGETISAISTSSACARTADDRRPLCWRANVTIQMARCSGVVRAYEDITERRRAEDQLQRVAPLRPAHRPANRLSLQKQLGRLLSGSGPKEPTAIALFDLDGFKDVNDTLGHSTGDQLLIEVGSRLTEVAGARGQLSRLGGDEFIVVIPGCGDPLEIGRLIDAALQRLAEPYEINDRSCISRAVRLAIAPTDGAASTS